ncbi:MAG: cation:proton antiporter [Magnetococcales bacterium]|nr:cation:proton antiporter [Magnetococcales bacterium]
MDTYLILIVGAMAIAVLLNLILHYLSMPPVLGYIATGVTVSALFGLGGSGPDPLLQEIGELGIVFLMFTIGLEFSMEHLREMRREVLLHGGLQVLLTGTLLGTLAHTFLDVSTRGAIIIGLALALSSTAIVLKWLNDEKESHKPYGRHVMGILIFQDLSVIPILVMIRFFTNQDHTITFLLLETMVGAAAAFTIIYLMGKFVIDRLLKAVSDARSHELFVAAVLLIVVAAALLTHSLGFSYSLGAFLAGLMIAETKYRYQVEADLVPFRNLLLGVFFVTVGMQVQLSYLLDHWLLISTLAAGLILIKGLMVFALIRLTENSSTAIKAGLALAQGGGFSFAVFQISNQEGLLASDLVQLLVIVMVLTMFLTPLILRHLDRLGDFFSTAVDEDPKEANFSTLENNRLVTCGVERCLSVEMEDKHVVVIGYGDLGKLIMRQLKEQSFPAVAIEFQRRTVQEGMEAGDAVIFGNAAQRTILEKAFVGDALAVIIAMEDKHSIRLVCEAVAEVAHEPVIVVRQSEKIARTLLEGLPIKSLVDENKEVARILIEHATQCNLPS